ncbi:MAG TPA: thioredoxin [Bacteroidales bacterium]|nr:thioredoxin [Bacteroidales bacterium]
MAEHPALIILSDQNFDETVASGLSLVDFWAPWCGPCRIVGPIISTLASDYEGRMKVGKLNVDENPLTAAKYGIRSIPTIMIFKDGKLVEKVVGAKPKPVLEKMIQKYLS